MKDSDKTPEQYLFWDTEETKLLLQMLGHTSVTEIANRLNRTEASVISKINRMGKSTDGFGKKSPSAFRKAVTEERAYLQSVKEEREKKRSIWYHQIKCVW